eukprot:6202383-Pleurochrysis_carterae.AAC.5
MRLNFAQNAPSLAKPSPGCALRLRAYLPQTPTVGAAATGNSTPERYALRVRPEYPGAWLLHDITLDDWFVVERHNEGPREEYTGSHHIQAYKCLVVDQCALCLPQRLSAETNLVYAIPLPSALYFDDQCTKKIKYTNIAVSSNVQLQVILSRALTIENSIFNFVACTPQYVALQVLSVSQRRSHTTVPHQGNVIGTNQNTLFPLVTAGLGPGISFGQDTCKFLVSFCTTERRFSLAC